MLSEYMKRLCRELEINPIKPSSGGGYPFPFDENTFVMIEEIQEGIALACPFAPCPTREEESFCGELLYGNLFGEGTSMATLGLSKDENQIVLTRKLEMNFTYEEFRNALEDFLNTIEYWQNQANSVERGT